MLIYIHTYLHRYIYTYRSQKGDKKMRFGLWQIGTVNGKWNEQPGSGVAKRFQRREESRESFRFVLFQQIHRVLELSEQKGKNVPAEQRECLRAFFLFLASFLALLFFPSSTIPGPVPFFLFLGYPSSLLQLYLFRERYLAFPYYVYSVFLFFSFFLFFLFPPPRTPVSLSLFSSSPMSPTFSPSLAFALIFFSNFRPRRRAIFHFPSRIVDEVGCVRQPPSRREFHIYKRVNIYSTLVDSFLLIHCPFFRLFYSFPFYHSDRLPPILQHETLYTSFAFL